MFSILVSQWGKVFHARLAVSRFLRTGKRNACHLESFKLTLLICVKQNKLYYALPPCDYTAIAHRDLMHKRLLSNVTKRDCSKPCHTASERPTQHAIQGFNGSTFFNLNISVFFLTQSHFVVVSAGPFNSAAMNDLCSGA